MKILITGSNGLLGQKLVGLLQAEGVDFLASSQGENRIKNNLNFAFTSLDITDKDQIFEVFEKYRPSHLIHTAAMTNVDQCELEPENCKILNVKAVEFLAEACKKYQTFFCHLSTDFIFDGQAGPYTEEAIPNPISIYGESKLASEKILMDAQGFPWAIARTILVYGIVEDMSRTNIILWVKKSLENNQEIRVVTDQWRSPTLAEDLAMGCWKIISLNKQGVFNISGKDFLSPYEMAIQTAEYFKLNKQLILPADSSNFSQPAKRPPRTGFILDKAYRELNYEPRSFLEGIEILANQTK